ncbi:MAG TPA: hypothetical protein ENI13_01005, partial [candidate division CPR3 bacterium]|nr:hypothetical protein [candidate division CPR3 bacterium]
MSKFISLQQATEYCDYTQEYLSLRARQKKLKAQKIGRNWVTTRGWLQEYIESAEDYKNGDAKKIAFQPRRVEPVGPLPFEMDFEEIVEEPRRLPSFKLAGVVALIMLLVFTGAFGKEGIIPLLSKIDAGVQGFAKGVEDGIVATISFDYATALQKTAAVAAGGVETLGEGFTYGAQNPAAVGEVAKEYLGWLQAAVTELPRQIAETYQDLDSSITSGIQNDVQSIVGFGTSVKQEAENSARSLVSIPGNIFSKLTQKVEPTPAAVDETPAEVKEEPVKEIVKEVEVERIVRVEQVKEIRTEVKTIDSQALLEIRAQIATVLDWFFFYFCWCLIHCCWRGLNFL